MLRRLLYISVSPQGPRSSSRNVADEFLKAYREKHADAKVIERDLNANPVPHLDGEAISAGYVPEEARSPGQREKHQYRLDLIHELVNADDILISTPMWNWGPPSVFKAYIDQIIMFGYFDVTEHRKLTGKNVTIVIAAGGTYSPGSKHAEGWDHQTSYLKHVFTELGADTEVVRTELTLAGIVPYMASLVDKKEESFKNAVSFVVSRAQK